MTVPSDLRDQARALYCVDRLTFEQVSREVGAAPSTLKNWSADEDWPARRRELRQRLRDIEEKKIKLRQGLIDQALETLDPQDVYALTRLERVAQPSAQTGNAPGVDRPAMFLTVMEFIAEVLKETDPAGLEILSRNFDFIVQRGKEHFSES